MNDSLKKINDAAVAEFADKGFDAARMDEIAKISGVNKALIYYYYKSKVALLQNIIDEFFDSTVKRIKERAQSTGSTEQVIDELAKIYEENTDLFKIVMIEIIKNTEIGKSFFKKFKEIHESTANYGGRSVKNLIYSTYILNIPLGIFLSTNKIFSEIYGLNEQENIKIYKRFNVELIENLRDIKDLREKGLKGSNQKREGSA